MAQQPKTLNDLPDMNEDFFDQGDVPEQQEDERTGPSMPGFFWMNKRPDADTGEENHSGWHAAKRVWPRFDDVMEQVVAADQARVVKISHTDKEGHEVIKEYWHLSKGARVFVLSRGLQPAWKMSKEPESNVGIAYGWPFDRGRDKNISHLKFQALLLPLVKAGYDDPVTFACARTWTLNLMECLQQHQRVVDAANALLKAHGKPENIRYRHVALDLLQAEKADRRGSGNDIKLCFAIVTNIPKSPEPIPDKFITSRYCGKDIKEMVDALLHDAEEWSKMTGVIWRDGNPDAAPQNGNGNGKIPPESEANFDPFGTADIPDAVPEEPAPELATEGQRNQLRAHAQAYMKYGETAKAQRLSEIAARLDLTPEMVAKEYTQASHDLLDLKKKKSAAPAPGKR